MTPLSSVKVPWAVWSRACKVQRMDVFAESKVTVMGSCKFSAALAVGGRISKVESATQAAIALPTLFLQKTRSILSPLIKACLKKAPADPKSLANRKPLHALRANVYGEQLLKIVWVSRQCLDGATLHLRPAIHGKH